MILINAIVFIIICTIFLISTLILFYYVIKYRKAIKEYLATGSRRQGFYIEIIRSSGSNYDVYVFVDELEQYLNGYSSIKFAHAEALRSWGKGDLEDAARKKFITIKLTKDIEWCEDSKHLREQRKLKLQEILKKNH